MLLVTMLLSTVLSVGGASNGADLSSDGMNNYCEGEKPLSYMKAGEELSTVGIDYHYGDGTSCNASGYPITENLLRAQLGYGVRIDYDTDDKLPQNEIFKKADRSLLYVQKGNN